MDVANKGDKRYPRYRSTISALRVSTKIRVQTGSATLSCLADSGADGYAYMSLSTARSLNLPVRKLASPVYVDSFQGHFVEIIRFRTDSVKFQIAGRDFSICFDILDTCSTDIILGYDWLQHHGAVIDYEQKTLLFLNQQAWTALRSLVASRTDSTFVEVEFTVSGMEPSTLEQIPQFLKSYAAVFNTRNAQLLPPIRPEYDMKIELTDPSPLPKSVIYRLSAVEEAKLKEELDLGLASGKIVSCNSQHASPVIYTKRNGKLRMCVDYRKLNSVSKVYQASIPRMDDLIHQYAGCSLYSKIDLKGAFNLLRMDASSEDFTAFQTKFGTFKYRVVPFGLRNGPTVFQRFMCSVLADIPQAFVYFDDLIVIEPNYDEHVRILREIFSRLMTHRLVVALEKCSFLVPSVEFLGHRLTSAGISMLDDKLASVKNFPVPANKKE
jgi:hypothetical protein